MCGCNALPPIRKYENGTVLSTMAASIASVDSSDDSEIEVYNPTTIWVKEVKHRGTRNQPNYLPIQIDLIEFPASFALHHDVDATPQALLECFFPDSVINRFVESTNNYALLKLGKKTKVRKASHGDILRFIAIIYYMGLVRLPAKEDYFSSNSKIWPLHPAIKLSYTRFRYMWRYFHMQQEAVPDEEDGTDDEMDDDEIESFSDLEQDDDSDDEDTPHTPTTQQKWYNKAFFLVEHVNKISQRLCRNPGFALAIDEMMKKFKGRSAHAHFNTHFSRI